MTERHDRIVQSLSASARKAIQDALGVQADPDVRETADPRFGDYQINGVLPLAKTLKKNPRELASQVVAALDTEGLCLPPEIAGPGFINLRLDPAWVAAEVARRTTDPARMGVAAASVPQSIVIDFSSPNVAKRMHVGHLRSTIIGDALARTLRFLGHRVIGDNHIGDWGTQFGILIWAWKHHADPENLERDPIGELERLYKLGSEKAKQDPAIAEATRAELARLQQGDAENRALWQRFVAISRAEAERIYERLNVTFDTWHGESFYNDALPGIVEELEARGLARESQGAIAVFFPEETGMAEQPFLVQKSDGAYLYSTTDLATLKYRQETYHPDRIIYVVDVRQSLHFKQLFTTARMMGMEGVELEHVGFGMMLGADGRPFKTREGGTITLESLLDEAEERVLPIVREKWPNASDDEQREIASAVGIGAVKYADLSQNLATDYKFEWDKLLAFDGNTGPYLLYTLVRTRAILREYESRSGEAFVPSGEPLTLVMEQEKDLAKELLRFGDVLDRVGRLLRPHLLCEYLFGLARKTNPFYAACPVLRADSDALRRSRLTLCAATAQTLAIGLSCLNIPTVERM